MPLQATSGAASQDAFGGNGVAVVPTYIEEVFSTYVYQGNASGQTITNNIDLTKGGLIWSKCRTLAYDHVLVTTTQGLSKYLVSSLTDALATNVQGVTSVSATGYAVGTGSQWGGDAAEKFVGWTFRKQPKFFDIVTYTGNGTTQNIAHSLGSTVGCVIVKCTNAGASWFVWHRGQTAGYYSTLNTTSAQTNANSTITFGNNTTYVDPTSTQFTVGSNGNINDSGNTYVAYLFAHDAGGFGLTGTDNVISCGSFTTDGSGNATVSLGYEPQWVMIKQITTAGEDWGVFDNMRGWATGNDRSLYPNLSNAETAETFGEITATGFVTTRTASKTYIYIAIRRPMKVPTTGTSVFATVARTGTGAAATVTAGFPVDMYLMQRRPNHFPNIVDRLRGNTRNIQTYQTDAETTNSNTITGFDNMTAVPVGADTDGYVNESAVTYVNQMFRRAPSFMDVVCYTGDGTANRQLNHNLTVTPELIIAKRRSAAQDWVVFGSAVGSNKYLILNTTAASDSATIYTSTSTTFGAQANLSYNTSAATYVAYLFSTCAGVSKVGSYTGTAATLQIDCGFTAGARFVLIKRTDSTGGWYVWDTARGIVSGNDPYLLLNSTAAEVTNTDYIDTYSAGFEISSTAPAAINASGGTYIFLAIA